MHDQRQRETQLCTPSGTAVVLLAWCGSLMLESHFSFGNDARTAQFGLALRGELGALKLLGENVASAVDSNGIGLRVVPNTRITVISERK